MEMMSKLRMRSMSRMTYLDLQGIILWWAWFAFENVHYYWRYAVQYLFFPTQSKYDEVALLFMNIREIKEQISGPDHPTAAERLDPFGTGLLKQKVPRYDYGVITPVGRPSSGNKISSIRAKTARELYDTHTHDSVIRKPEGSFLLSSKHPQTAMR